MHLPEMVMKEFDFTQISGFLFIMSDVKNFEIIFKQARFKMF